MQYSSWSSYSSSSSIPPLMVCSRKQQLIFICLSICLLLISTIPTAAGVLQLPPGMVVPAVIGFGDSIIDPGNNNNLKTIIKCNFPPYGKDFMGGIPTGRFSNGKIPTDILASELSIKEYVPAYLDPTLGPQDLLTGVSFASGATGYDPLTSKIASVEPLPSQLEQFKEYKGRLKQIVGEERTKFIVNNSFVLIVAGSDDLANTYFTTPFRKKHYDIDSYTDLLLKQALSFAQDVYNEGARRMAIFGAPPIGCLPSQRTLGGGITRECSEEYNHAAQLYNSKLSAQLDALDRKLSDAKVIYIDIYTPLFDLIQNPHKYGLEQTHQGCCGTGLIEVSVLCNKFDPVCPDPSKYLFWDSYHPTEKGYQLLVDLLLAKYFRYLFEL